MVVKAASFYWKFISVTRITYNLFFINFSEIILGRDYTEHISNYGYY